MAVLGQYGVTEPGIELLQNRRAEEQVLLVLGKIAPAKTTGGYGPASPTADVFWFAEAEH